MGLFTIVPAWIVQDVIVVLVGVVVALFIVRREEHPASIILEMLCFTVLYAAVYENFATLQGNLYGYGRTLFMIANVPLAVPLVEYLVVYSMLRMLSATALPAWGKPLVVGFGAMLFDFALDPLAIRLVYPTMEGTIGRWTWFMNPGDAGIYGEPVFNFSGWMLICGYATVFLLLGRWWHRRSGHARAVGYLYPVLAMVPSLALVVSPVSNFLLWLEPLSRRGSSAEWIMLGVWLAVPVVVLAAAWRGRMRAAFRLSENVPVILVLVGLPLVTVVSTMIHGAWDVLWLETLAAAALAGLVAAIAVAGRRVQSTPAGAPTA